VPLTQTPRDAWQAFQRAVTIVAKAQPNPMIAPALRKAVAAVDPLLPLYDVQTLDNAVAESTATRRFNTQLLTFLGITGLILAAIGIYGVIAFFVTQQTQEIGVRIALGSSRARVIGLVVGQATTLALVGIALGTLTALWATRVFDNMLYQVGVRDPLAYTLAALTLLMVALVAACSRRAGPPACNRCRHSALPYEQPDPR
jgi:ABC-type antimicrobial peptide transport system permease subunit